MNAVIYIRVSTEEQAKEGFSLEFQESYLTEYAKKQDISIVKKYEDQGVSGKSMRKREGLKSLLLDSKEQNFSAVLVWKLNRLARNTEDSLSIMKKLSKNNILITSISEPFDTSTAFGRFMFTILSAQAEFENEIRGDNIRAAISKKNEKEKMSFRHMLGYKYKENGAYVVDHEADLVRQIFVLYAKHKNASTVASFLNQNGMTGKRGKPFSAGSILVILKNRNYLGAETYPGIIKKRKFNQVQEILTKKRRKS